MARLRSACRGAPPRRFPIKSSDWSSRWPGLTTGTCLQLFLGRILDDRRSIIIHLAQTFPETHKRVEHCIVRDVSHSIVRNHHRNSNGLIPIGIQGGFAENSQYVLGTEFLRRSLLKKEFEGICWLYIRPIESSLPLESLCLCLISSTTTCL